MARSRNIKPGFFKNEILAEMPPEYRLLFMGLWCLADREGRFEDRPKKIKMELFPCDDFDIGEGLSMLESGGFLVRYVVDGNRYSQVVNFTKHQMPHHKEVASEIPAPPGFDQITKHTYDVSKATRDEVFQRDGMACLRCGATDSLSLDHIVPLGSGGDNATSNLQTLCKSCNSSKGNTTKDYRQFNVESTLDQHQNNEDASCPPDSGFLIPDSPIPDSLKKTPRKRVTAKPVVEKPEDVCLQVWIDWCSLRKEKRAPVTVTVIDSARGEAAKAGMTFEDFLRVWCRRGSQGLEASWIKSNERPASKPAETFAERDERNAKERYERLTGRKHPDLLPQHLNIIEADPIVRIAA